MGAMPSTSQFVLLNFQAKGEQIAENFVLGLSRLCHLDDPIRQLGVAEEKLKNRLKEVAEKKKQFQAVEEGQRESGLLAMGCE